MEQAVIDMWLLGEVEEVVISPYSTYGSVAHARTSKVGI
jgi:hypothetical protein